MSTRLVIIGLACVLLLALIPLSRTRKTIEGRVVDAGTGRPLAGVAVQVRNRGWGRDVTGHVIWDRDYVYPATTDAGGRFRIAFRVGASAHVVASAPGYATVDQWYDAGADVAIRMMRARR